MDECIDVFQTLKFGYTWKHISKYVNIQFYILNIHILKN